MLKTFLQHIAVVLYTKTALKTSLYSKNESNTKIAKNGHQAKAIDFAKSSFWVKNLKCTKTCLKRFYNTLQLFYAEKRLQRKAYIQKMRAILELPKMATKQRL